MSTKSETETPPRSRRELITQHVRRQVRQLQRAFLHNEGRSGASATADLARLRRANPLDPGADPEVFPIVFETLPAELIGQDDSPSSGEVAVSSALHLFAIHQQGRAEGAHLDQARFGQSVRRLAMQRGDGNLDLAVLTRLQHLSHASSAATRLGQLRALVKLMRSAGIQLDYGTLAADLDALSRRPDDSSVYLAWGRQFHQGLPSAPSTDSTVTNPTENQE